MFKLAIDPGHGMGNTVAGVYDSGAVGGGQREADIALAWSLTLKYYAVQAGLAVWMTREDDHAPAPLGQRVERAQAERCTHYLAIHADSGSVLASGTQAIYRTQADLVFGAAILACNVAATGLRSRGMQPESSTHVGRLAVMEFPGPVTLLETGFVTNPIDRSRITDRARRIAFAERCVGFLKTIA